jgi:hypothetical protein
MKLRNFVSSSALFLAGWLGFTFIHEVPTQRYPKLDKYTATPREAPDRHPTEMAASTPEAEVFQVSVSQ